MAFRGLRPTVETSAASWIVPRLGPFGSAIVATVPAGFEAYARVLHPPGSGDRVPLRWSQIAESSGRTAHACMQFDAIAGLVPHQPRGPKTWDGQRPELGNLRTDLLEVLSDVLARHIGAPEQCWFCLWDGYGWIRGSPSAGLLGRRGRQRVAAAFPREVLEGPRVHLPGPDYLLFEGPLAAATEMGHWLTPTRFISQSPNLLWPRDRSWCVATEIDFDSTLIGGSRSVIDEMLNQQALEVWRVQPSDSLARDGDTINT